MMSGCQDLKFTNLVISSSFLVSYNLRKILKIRTYPVYHAINEEHEELLLQMKKCGVKMDVRLRLGLNFFKHRFVKSDQLICAKVTCFRKSISKHSEVRF